MCTPRAKNCEGHSRILPITGHICYQDLWLHVRLRLPGLEPVETKSQRKKWVLDNGRASKALDSQKTLD